MPDWNADLKGVADALAAHCRAGTEREGLKALYSADAVSVEAADGGNGREARGIAAIEAKHDWWDGAMEVHGASVDGPLLHGEDRFALVFEIDATDRASGERMRMREVGVYTVAGGKVVREEFYYAP